MGNCICKMDGWYFIYSTISDAIEPARAFTLAELHVHIREEYGRAGLERLPARLARVEEAGTEQRDTDLSGTLWLNRAGAGETWLTREQLLPWLVARRTNPHAPQPVGIEQPDDIEAPWPPGDP